MSNTGQIRIKEPKEIERKSFPSDFSETQELSRTKKGNTYVCDVVYFKPLSDTDGNYYFAQIKSSEPKEFEVRRRLKEFYENE